VLLVGVEVGRKGRGAVGGRGIRGRESRGGRKGVKVGRDGGRGREGRSSRGGSVGSSLVLLLLLDGNGLDLLLLLLTKVSPAGRGRSGLLSGSDLLLVVLLSLNDRTEYPLLDGSSLSTLTGGRRGPHILGVSERFGHLDKGGSDDGIGGGGVEAVDPGGPVGDGDGEVEGHGGEGEELEVVDVLDGDSGDVGPEEQGRTAKRQVVRCQ
jgi:hypothetical protein